MIHEYTYSTRDEWLALRKPYIGGSEAGAVMGMDLYKSPYALWAEKTGRVPAFEGNIITRVGAYLEEFVAQLFCEATGKKVRRKNRMMVNDRYPWACADVDRVVVGEDAILECKTTNSTLVMKSVRNGEFPDRWYCQMMHYLAVTEKQRAYLGVLVSSRDFYWFTLERDDAEIAILMDSERVFHQGIQSDTPPPQDGLDSTSEALSAIYADGGGCDMELFGRTALLRERSQLVKSMKAMGERKTEIDNIIKADMGPSERAAADGFRITWKPQQHRAFQERAFRADHPDIDLSRYYKTATRRVFKITEQEEK